jgi:membrane-associated phospholipid phosphatase
VHEARPQPPGDRLVAQRLGEALRGLHPIVGALLVATFAFTAVATVAVLLGALVERWVVHGAIGRTDLDIARWLAERRTPTRNDLSVVGSYLAETVTVVALVVVVAAVLALRRRWWLAAFVIVSLCLEALVYLVATFVIVRDRPAVPRLEHLIVSDSFPSGHTAAAAAIYGSIAVVVWVTTTSRLGRSVFLGIAVLFPVLVALSRVYRGMHNPSDVVCGALLGAGCIAGGWFASGAGAELAARRRLPSVREPEEIDLEHFDPEPADAMEAVR